jgi:hypothetical protein
LSSVGKSENASTLEASSLQSWAVRENASTNTHRAVVAIGLYNMSLSVFADYRYVKNVRPIINPLLHNVSLCMQGINLVTVTCEAV